MSVLDSLAKSGIVPVVVLENAQDAVPTAKALLKGGISVMEITFRTAAAADSIKAVAEGCPEMLVGAGTVITLDQCKQAVACGAKFIVSPGFDAEVVGWCVENGVAVTPGCVTPSEIMAAMKFGLKVLKFFPAGIYGGLAAMKALSGPFGGVKFIPTGGVNAQNIGEFIAAPFIHAVGGSWVCPKADIAAGNFDKITELSKQARNAALGFELAHIGINCEDASAAADVCGKLNEAFDLPVKNGNSSMFASNGIEVMKSVYLGEKGHIAIRTNTISLAIAALEEKGFVCDMTTAKYKGDRMVAVYLQQEIGGFAIHLLQK
ncbi:MAG: bifunctional 4-hydroxy-2-oxoglutarate aldolase/2-dehydro-3-deoxy-phosphogluconate aldolase [Clostridia bacterium]|nr:bifunctional 4-hydroxy-2-oxoglutarate aldolase/2-dehydro-3-deoxy-phosphogluconate aldolase [Clostridia bacterium]